MAKCKYCGKEFASIRPNHIFCCSKCASDQYRFDGKHRRVHQRFKERHPGYDKRQRVIHKDRNQQRNQDTRDRHLLEVIRLYGSKCQECGYDNPIVFQFHHVKGLEHFGINGRKGNDRQAGVVCDVLRAGQPLKEYMMLCANCHVLADLRDGTNTRGQRIKRALETEAEQTRL